MSECEETANTINRLVEAGHIAKAQELLELALDDHFVLQLAMFANTKVNAYATIAAWKQAGLRLPAEDTDKFYPYRDSPSVTEEQLKEQLKTTVDKLTKERRSNTKEILLFIVGLPIRFAFALISFTFLGWGGWVGIVLFVLKVTGIIHWPWWVATLPLEYGVLYCLYMTIDGALYRAGIKSVGGYARWTTPDEHLELAAQEKQTKGQTDAFLTGKQIWKDITLTGGSPEFRETKKKEALRYFDQAIANGYDASEVFSLRGSCLNDLGFYFEALEDYNKAIQQRPSKGIASNYHMRSMIKQSLLDFQGSLADLNEAIRLSKLDNDDNRWWNNHANTMGFKSATEVYEDSLPLVNSLIEREKTSPTDKSAELRKIKRRGQIS
jgi:tetratricopeptide (TPR) repeat protein